MKIALSWLREFVELSESTDELRVILDDLGLVVEGIEYVGEGLEDVVVVRIDEIRAIEGADRVRLVTVDTGDGPLEIVCGAMNIDLGDHVPLAPVGAVLPGGFEIARRQMRGVTSNGMLCSARELGLGDDHGGLMVLDDLVDPVVGQGLLDALAITPDVVFDITVEGNRPDAWSVEGVARDLATRLGRPLAAPPLAQTNSDETSTSYAAAGIDAPDLCGRLTVSVLRHVAVRPSPAWVVARVQSAGMRAISNVVDASNLVMLELGQPTHAYDAAHVAGRTIRARRARRGETLVTLDGVERQLATVGRGLGDTGEDCVIVDGDDTVLGLAGIMGGAASEISDATTDVLLEAAYFDPMAIARSSKRHALRTEGSNRFERGVDPQLPLRATARFVQVLTESCPELEWLRDPLDVAGDVPTPPTVVFSAGDIERVLGVAIPSDTVTSILQGLRFEVRADAEHFTVVPSTARPDVRSGVEGSADVIEEIARLYGYRRLPRHAPTWPEPGGLTERQKLRRRVRDIVVDLGANECWTPTLGSDADFDLLRPGVPRVRITNPLASDESVLRPTMLTGLVRVWGKNLERGTGDVVLAEIGNVFTHPDATASPRRTRGGVGGALTLDLPDENERVTVVLGRDDDDATTAVAFWNTLADRLGLADVVVRSTDTGASGFHPTRVAQLVDRRSGAVLGFVGEVDGLLVEDIVTGSPRRLGLLDVDFDALCDETRATRRDHFAKVPSRFPSAVIDLALVTPQTLHAQDLAFELRGASELVERVELFDVYRGANLPGGTRSLAYRVRFNSDEGTLAEKDVANARSQLIARAESLGAVLR
ncbi:MAG TPA: phenylalanine--tRNA ligase subunit beta [Acidimicrobiales bacterium]